MVKAMVDGFASNPETLFFAIQLSNLTFQVLWIFILEKLGQERCLNCERRLMFLSYMNAFYSKISEKETKESFFKLGRC